MNVDLLSLVSQGGCSAKIAPDQLSSLLQDLPLLRDNNIMVDSSTHDDAGVYQINESTALIVTTDFFPPICSSPYDFGQIAAANSLSDIYAMGGTPLLTLNLTLFPSKTLPLEVLKEILLGGQHKTNEAGAFTMGGHTIENDTPVFGLAVVGTAHPDKLITNAGLRVGQKLILTKPLGTGVLVAAQRMGIADYAHYQSALVQMKILNRTGAELMQKYGVRGATDITGFGLLGHAYRMADASNVSIQFESSQLPVLAGVDDLLIQGCVPGTSFRNLRFVNDHLSTLPSCSTERKMVACDAQTSGGLLMGIDEEYADTMIEQLKASGEHPQCAIVGEVIPRRSKLIYLA